MWKQTYGIKHTIAHERYLHVYWIKYDQIQYYRRGSTLAAVKELSIIITRPDGVCFCGKVDPRLPFFPLRTNKGLTHLFQPCKHNLHCCIKQLQSLFSLVWAVKFIVVRLLMYFLLLFIKGPGWFSLLTSKRTFTRRRKKEIWLLGKLSGQDDWELQKIWIVFV